MSQLIAPSHTFTHSIPIRRRLREIMQEKGGAFTISALAPRIGMNRETFRKLLNGDREIYTFELEKIASEMHLSVARILQEDVKEIVEELEKLLVDNSNLPHAKKLAEQLLSVAVGVTERCEALIYAGRVYFELQSYEISHQYRTEAYTLATIIKDTYSETNQFNTTIRNLLTSFTVRNDYTNAYVMMERARENLGHDPHRHGEIAYTLAMIAYGAGRLVEAKEHLQQSLAYYQKSSDQKEIGKALHNVAFIEYKLKNYAKAQELFEQSILTLEDYPPNKLIAIKDYVKVLIKLGRHDEALQLIETGLQNSCLPQTPDLEAKLLILRSIYSESVTDAVSVLESSHASNQLKYIACKFLMDYYAKRGDSELLMKYYISIKQFTVSESNRYGEEDL